MRTRPLIDVALQMHLSRRDDQRGENAQDSPDLRTYVIAKLAYIQRYYTYSTYLILGHTMLLPALLHQHPSPPILPCLPLCLPCPVYFTFSQLAAGCRVLRQIRTELPSFFFFPGFIVLFSDF